MVPSKQRVARPNFSLVDTWHSPRPEVLSLFNVIIFNRVSFISMGLPTRIKVPPIFVSY
jgi:hypothetical protein